MAGRRAISPRPAASVAPNDVEDPATSRAITSLSEAVARLQERASWQAVTQDLEVGINTVRHSLGRAPVVCLVTPTVADATFAYSAEMDTRQVLVTILGVAQPGASVFLI